MHHASHNYTELHRASHDSYSEIDIFLIRFRRFSFDLFIEENTKFEEKIAMNQADDKKAEKVLKKRIKDGKVSFDNILLDLSLIPSA